MRWQGVGEWAGHGHQRPSTGIVGCRWRKGTDRLGQIMPLGDAAEDHRSPRSEYGRLESRPAGTGSDPVRRDIVLNDASLQAQAQPWADLDCRQIGPGHRVGLFSCIDLGPLRLVRETQDAAVHKVGAMKSGCCTVSFFDTRNVTARSRQSRFSQYANDGASNRLFFLPSGLEFDIHVGQGLRTEYVTFDQNALLERLRALDPHRWEASPRDLLAFDTPRRAALTEALTVLFEPNNQMPDGAKRRPDPDRMVRAMTDAAAFALAGGGGNANDERPHALTPDRALRIMRAAYAYCRETIDADELPSMADLCARIGVSERSVQYAFRSHLSIAPATYLRLARMNRVRSCLLAPDQNTPGVTDVAMRWGFFHLGRFAQQYRAMYDETPSETLARSIRKRA